MKKSNNTFKKPRKKRCKVCNESFTPYLSTQVVCSTKCAQMYAKKKVEKDKKLIEDRIKEKKEKQSLSYYLTNTKNLVHKYIRERDKGKNCISCGAQWSKDFQAGHFYPAGKFTSIKFDLDNIHGQCPQCNLYKEGNFDNYSLNLPNRIGEDRYKSLVKKAELDKKFNKKWTRTELNDIRNQVKIKLKKYEKK